MRTIFLIKHLLKESDLKSVNFELDEKNNLIITTEPKDNDLQEKIQDLLKRELENYMNSI